MRILPHYPAELFDKAYIHDFKIGDKDVRSRDKQKLIQREQDSENVPIWVNDISEIFG